MDAASELLLILVCLILSAFFSGSETALLRLGKHQIEADIAGTHGLPALAARNLVEHTGKLLVTILLGNNVVNILAAAVASSLAIRLLGEQRGLLVSTIALTVVVLVFCEILPKAVAARSPRRASYAVALPLYVIHKVLRPIHWIFERGIDPLVRAISGGDEEGGPAGSDELLELARRMTTQAPSASPVGILGNTAHAVERTVEEVMTPRTAIFAASRTTSPADLLDLMLAERHTRVPIWEDSIDDVVGLVHFKDLAGLVRGAGSEIDPIIRPVLRVPERKPILELLAEMQREASNLALVKDEFGLTVGLVTQEDVLEELVGELRDEFDAEELEQIRRISETSYEVAGEVTVLDFNRVSGWTVDGMEAQSLGGVVFNALGRVPGPGDRVEVQGHAFTVLSCSGTHIHHIRVEQLRAAP